MNKVTKKKKYPLLRTDDLFDQLNEAKVFSQMDLATRFHQLRVSKDNATNTAFRTPPRFYE